MTPIVLGACVVYSGIILVLLRGLLKIGNISQVNDHKHLFSVIIAAHNEEETIAECLASVCNQSIDSSRYEVIVVNDRSTDATAVRIAECMQKYPCLKTINITIAPYNIAPKKNAVLQGIALAKNPIIVYTDADCRVLPTWLQSINEAMLPHVKLLQGVTLHTKLPEMNELFFGMQALDFCSHGVIAAAGIGAGIPINSNANNMAFRKESFGAVGGYGGNEQVVLGDDDLLVQKVFALGKNAVQFSIDPKGSVVTLPTKTPRELFEQRKKWGSVTVHYGPKQVILLGTIFVFYLFLTTLIIGSFFNISWLPLAVCVLFTKVVGEIVLLWPGTRMFGATALRPYIIPASLLHLPMVLVAVVMGVFFKFDWKGQKFRRKLE